MSGQELVHASGDLRWERARRLAGLDVETPHLEYDGAAALHSLEAMRKGFPEGIPEVEVHLALKSCYCRPLLELFADEGIGAEVMSGLEYSYARSCGFEASDIVVNGLGRGEDGMRRAVAEGATVIVDSDGDLQALGLLLAGQEGDAVSIGVRLRLDMGAGGEADYGGEGSKLGTPPGSRLLQDVIAWAAVEPRARLEMVHVHLATNERSAGAHIAVLEALAKEVEQIEGANPGLEFRRVNLGGGFGTFAEDEADRAVTVFAELGQAFSARFPSRTLVVEPGRYLTNRAGSMVGTVIDLKPEADRTIVVSDIAMNVLIPNESARYSLEHPRTGEGQHRIILADGITSPDHVVLEGLVADPPRIGDRVVVGSCGAYSNVFACVWAYDVPTVSYVDPAGNRMQLLTDDDVAARRAAELGL